MTEDRRELIYKNADTAPVLYINSVQFAHSPFDIRLLLGVIEDANDDRVVTRVSATVFMSPQHVKVFAELLNRQIAKYEASNGPIPPVSSASGGMTQLE